MHDACVCVCVCLCAFHNKSQRKPTATCPYYSCVFLTTTNVGPAIASARPTGWCERIFTICIYLLTYRKLHINQNIRHTDQSSTTNRITTQPHEPVRRSPFAIRRRRRTASDSRSTRRRPANGERRTGSLHGLAIQFATTHRHAVANNTPHRPSPAAPFIYKTRTL